MKKIKHKQEPTAVRLAMAIKRLRTRLREVAPVSLRGLPISQLAILQHLRSHGPTTASALAISEHVSQQAIAQNLAVLKSSGFIQAKKDSSDKRKSLISMTKAGYRLFELFIASRNAWLVQAINSTIPAKERSALEKAIELLERLADVDLNHK